MNLLGYAILIGLASFRLWRIVGEDEIAEPIRDRLYADAGHVRRFFADMFACSWCIGWWYCGALSGLVAWHESLGWVSFVLLWCASSTVCGLTKRLDR